MPVYLIHFDKNYRHTRHYIGYAKTHLTLVRRIKHHRAGNGARLIQVINHAGISWKVARVWLDQDRKFESYLKYKYKCNRRVCPVCNSNIELTPECQEWIDKLNE